MILETSLNRKRTYNKDENAILSVHTDSNFEISSCAQHITLQHTAISKHLLVKNHSDSNVK